MFQNLKDIFNYFIVSVTITTSLFIIPEHYNWVDAGFFEIIIFSALLCPFVIFINIAIKNFIEYGTISFLIDDLFDRTQDIFNILYWAIVRRSENDKSQMSNNNLKISIENLWTYFIPKSFDCEQLANYNILKINILSSIKSNDDCTAKQKIYNALGSSLYCIKNKGILLRRDINEDLNNIYNRYMTIDISWKDIYSFSNSYINFIELYELYLEEYITENKRKQNSRKNKVPDNKNVIYEKHFKVLHISSCSSFGEVKEAYRKRMKINHPDRFVNSGEAEKKKANEISQKINIAYYTLKKLYE